MSDELAADLTRIDGTPDAHPVGEPRTSPLVAFGLRTAALAGLAVPVGLLVGQLIAGDAGGGADVSAAPVITCCPTFEM
ncbi:hypothetical protein QQG74_20305 [Micromonospora sp. FIMYZ51]|uniref:hypothetical protein n=1 Tax=Micromonospora sp. FIMYZ51 TaxID=3051832 RepID=UPI00311D8D65